MVEVADPAAEVLAPEGEFVGPGDAEAVEVDLGESGATTGAGLQSDGLAFLLRSGRLEAGGFCAGGACPALGLDAAGVFCDGELPWFSVALTRAGLLAGASWLMAGAGDGETDAVRKMLTRITARVIRGSE